MKDFLRSIKFKVLIVVLALLFGIMLYAASTGGFATFPETVLHTITQPFVKLSSSISGAATGFFDKFINASEISKENERLREENTKLKEQMKDYDNFRYENEQYKELLKIKEQNPDYKLEPASIIGRDTEYKFEQFIINKGTLDGISLKDPVITPEGLIGYISRVGPTFATVTTVLDVSIDVGCYVSRTRDTGIISGDVDLSQKGLTKLMYLTRETTIAEGDLVITSGIGGIYPKGLIVGTIKEVKADTNGISVFASVKPAVDVANVKDVVVITDFFGQGIGSKADGQSENESPSKSAY